MAKVLVLDGHSAAALAFTRSLGRAGHWVAVGANRGIFAPAFLSRYCRARLEHPVSTDDSSAFASSVAEFARSSGVELIVPITDWTTLPLSQQRLQFQGVCPVVLPDDAALRLASDKYQTVELAQSLGIAVPETRLVHSMQDLELNEAMQFPVVVKDRFSVRWVENRCVFGSVSYAYTPEELRSKVKARLRDAGDVLLQNFVAGTGTGFSCFALNGDIRLPFAWQRIRETDPRGSGSSARKSIPLDPELLDISSKLVKQSGFQGIAMVEYKKDAQGRLVLMEINGRPWGSIQLPIASGIDYPRYVVDWWMNKAEPPSRIKYREGINCRRIVGELTHLENVRRGRPAGWPVPYPNFWSTAAAISIPWYPGVRYDDVSLSDPRPGLAGIANWFRVRLKK
ncbi:MAG TPA: ATP-grasp domain-containing protein [Terriglobales bacterium]|nr:ATP-grasp domain-containing protein [Terriglobales bacterium]